MITTARNKSNMYAHIALIALGYAMLVDVVVYIGAFRLNLYTDQAYTDPHTAAQPAHTLATFKYWHQMMRWDGGWYESIARRGYMGQETAFFPLYPVIVRAVLRIQANFASAAGFVSFVFFAGALYFFKRLSEDALDAPARPWALFFFLFFPTAFYLLAPYTESLFVCLLLGAVYYMRQKKYLPAGILGFLSGLARVNGFFLALALGYEAYRHVRTHGAKLWQNICAALSPLGGLAGYMLFLKIRFGNFVQFAASQNKWDRNGSLNPFDIAHRLMIYAREYAQLPGAFNAEFISRALDASFFIFIVITGVWMYRKWDKGYALFTLSTAVLPILSGTLLSMPRYVFASPFVPLFLARQIKNDCVRLCTLACFIPLWTILLILFSNGYWVA